MILLGGGGCVFIFVTVLHTLRNEFGLLKFRFKHFLNQNSILGEASVIYATFTNCLTFVKKKLECAGNEILVAGQLTSQLFVER